MSEKQLTPMQQFAEWYNDYCTNYGMYPNEWEVNKKIKELLPIEQKAIEDAYNQDLYGGLNGNRKYTDGKDYFEQTYKK